MLLDAAELDEDFFHIKWFTFVAGVCLAKMTPFRSYIVVASVAGAVAILGTFQMKGGVITYVIVSF